MTGKDPVAVYAKEFNPKGSWYRGDAAASCIFEMSDGVIFTYRASWCAEGCHTDWNGDWRLIGDKGTLECVGDFEPLGEVVAGDTGFYRKHVPAKVPKSPMKYESMHGHLREMLAYMRKGAMPQCECHDNIKSLAMVFGAIESSKKGKRVSIG
jgi:predicted dehydrogenase